MLAVTKHIRTTRTDVDVRWAWGDRQIQLHEDNALAFTAFPGICPELKEIKAPVGLREW